MRKSTDTCLLCQNNVASKTNSHIFPKFISTNFLGPKDSRKGFNLSSDTVLENKPRVVQDSPKEDFILCDECEAYFGILEGLSADTFTNWRSKVDKGEFMLKKIIDGFEVVECNTSDPRTIKLFVYSIFWRASISNIPLFENVEIEDQFNEDIRILLLEYRATKKSDYENLLKDKATIKVYPISIITASSFEGETANILHAPFSYDPYCLVVDRFGFMLFKSADEIKVPFLRDFSNLNIDDCKIMICSPQLWHDAILKRPFEMLAEQAKKKQAVAKQNSGGPA
jgi:hypothetical protein